MPLHSRVTLPPPLVTLSNVTFYTAGLENRQASENISFNISRIKYTDKVVRKVITKYQMLRHPPDEAMQERRTVMQQLAETLYSVESEKSVTRFVEDFATVVEKNDFVINNKTTMNMKETFTAHGGEVPDHFDLHMIQICKPTKANKSLSNNPERSVLMPKFVHVFTADNKTQVRYLSFTPEYIETMVPGDVNFPSSLEETYSKIRVMIDEAC